MRYQLDNDKYFSSVSDYKVIRLINGMEVIAILVKETSDTMTLKYPAERKIVPYESENGNTKAIIVARLSPLSDDEDVTIKKEHVLFINQLGAGASLQYRDMLLSGEFSPDNSGPKFPSSISMH